MKQSPRFWLLILTALFFQAPLYAQGTNAPTKQDEARARAMHNAGVSFYEAGRYKAAIEAFKEAYQLSQRHVMLLNIANAHERLGELTLAIEALKKFRPHASDEKRPALEKRIASLEARVKVEQMPKDPVIVSRETPTGTTPVVVQKEVLEQDSETNYLAWGLLLTGGALVLTGGTFFTLGEFDHRDLQDKIDDGSLNPRLPTQLEEARILDEEADRKKLIGYIALGAGAAASITSITLFVLSSEDPQSAPETTLRLTPSRRGATLTLQGGF